MCSGQMSVTVKPLGRSGTGRWSKATKTPTMAARAQTDKTAAVNSHSQWSIPTLDNHEGLGGIGVGSGDEGGVEGRSAGTLA